MSNTGYKHWSQLEEYYLDTGLPTGVTKPNTSLDPNYVAPVLDLNSCPLTYYTVTRSQSFTKNDCQTGQVGTSTLFTKDYTSAISQADAQSQADNDPNFISEGQISANQNGVCENPTPALELTSNGSGTLYYTKAFTSNNQLAVNSCGQKILECSPGLTGTSSTLYTVTPKVLGSNITDPLVVIEQEGTYRFSASRICVS